MDVPAISRVNGMMATSRMMKGVERVALTISPMIRFQKGAGNSSPLPLVARNTPMGRPMAVPIAPETQTM